MRRGTVVVDAGVIDRSGRSVYAGPLALTGGTFRMGSGEHRHPEDARSTAASGCGTTAEREGFRLAADRL